MSDSLPKVPTEHTLLGTTDMMSWAEEFCRIFKGATVGQPEGNVSGGHTYVDEGTMVSWFANAFELGRSTGRKELCPHQRTSDLSDDLTTCLDCGTMLGATSDQT